MEAHASRDQVVGSIKHALDDAGMEIPFPYRTLTIEQPVDPGAAAPASA